MNNSVSDNFIFLFDLDSTVTRQEILPTISAKIGRESEMRELTEMAMSGGVPFKQSFLKRVEMLKDIPISEIANVIANIELNEHIADFIRKNSDRCYVVTGNLDIWIAPLMEKLGILHHTYCSHAVSKDDRLEYVSVVVDKKRVIDQFIQPFVAVGDGDNDAEMIDSATVGIGYGGVRDIAASIIDCATHVFYDETTLVNFLNRLL